MKRHFQITLLFILLITLSGLVKAQNNTQPINLETVLSLGGANNLTIKEYKERQELAIADLSKSKEWWLPNLYAGVSTHQLWGNAMNSDGNFFIDVNRQSFWGGLGLNATWDFGDGIFKENAAKLKVQATVYQTQAEQNMALLDAIQTYYDFLASQLYYRAYEQLALQADTIANQIAIQVEVGLRFESELLLARRNYMHLKVEMLNARTEYNNRSATLVKLLNLNPTIRLVGTDTILAPLDLIVISDIPVSFDSTYGLRPELMGMELMLQSLNEEKKTTTTGLLLPKLRIGAYGSYFGGVFTPLDQTSEINAALIWKIPVGRLAYKGTLKQYNSRIVLQEIKMEQAKAQINEEVIRAREQIRVAKEQTQIALEGSQFAEEALIQSIQRQQLGTVRPFEILQAQEIYIKSRLDYLKAVASYNKTQYAYHVATGNNL
ncbi:MAG: hypothetical protein COA58_16110 [Bacteroidetes bacterium]|nr:MAG: hypothetical protein COA58_16110 [Bacteroidota bacterium]